MGSFIYQYLDSYKYLKGEKLLVLFFAYFVPSTVQNPSMVYVFLRAAVLLLANGPLHSANEPVHFNTHLLLSLCRTRENSETSGSYSTCKELH